ncbi:hypothetical protein Pmani_004010 [Petrolisthes manimaculis]|uniref:Uncharacterized protein n=1 Tax=Petrolisthes manimaculis TaxID=1843537 RepID=A0AAE1UNR2_9EUCA|nr:hypothetical protein Pmani_004010 [Petrolisthes manimaculis]
MDGLGDRKPSELINEMLALMEGHKSCLLFEQIFLEQMPEDIRLLLAQDTFTDPRGLAARADELWDKWCYYHQRLGSDARRCRPPCMHPGNASGGSL